MTTPDRARELLDGATPGPWHAIYEDDGSDEGIPAGIVSECADLDDQGYPIGNVQVFDRGAERTGDSVLASAAPDLAQTIAGMKFEYAVEHEHSPGNWRQVTQWGPEENPYQPGYGPGDDERIVRRLVGPVEVIDGE